MENKKPSDYKKRLWCSLFRNSEAEIIFANIMVILSNTGDEWRELSWEEYKEYRLKEKGFSEKEESYFNKVISYTLSADLAESVKEGVEGYVKKYKHNLDKIYFYRLKGYYIGYFFKDLDVLPKIIQDINNLYIEYDRTPDTEEKYELIELPILKYNPDWTFKSSWGESESENYKQKYFISNNLYCYNDHWHTEIKDRFRSICLETLTNIQEKEFVEVELIDFYTHFIKCKND